MTQLNKKGFMHHNLRLKRSISILFAFLPLCVSAKQVVLVGLAHFPPFIEARDDRIGGLAKDMLEIMNTHQSRYFFKAVPTLPATRHETFKLGRYDMSMFDNLALGWQGYDVESSRVTITHLQSLTLTRRF